MNAVEGHLVNDLFRNLKSGNLRVAMAVLEDLAWRANQALNAGVTAEDVEAWAADLPGYLVLGDSTAARAGDWGWLPISDDCRPADLVDVLLRHRGEMEGDETVSMGFRRSNGSYVLTDTQDLAIREPSAWMPMPYPMPSQEECV